MPGLNLIYFCNDVINMCIVRERMCAGLALQARECVCVCESLQAELVASISKMAAQLVMPMTLCSL